MEFVELERRLRGILAGLEGDRENWIKDEDDKRTIHFTRRPLYSPGQPPAPAFSIWVAPDSLAWRYNGVRVAIAGEPPLRAPDDLLAAWNKFRSTWEE